VSESAVFVGRSKQILQLRCAYAERWRVIIVGPSGIDKTALLPQAQQYVPLLLCEETSRLRRICESLERQLRWTHRKMNLIESKNRLLPYLVRRADPVDFDALALTPPGVARFIHNRD
jgi:ABC-type phosphate/phosphonate transport system ATPase subunit